MDRAKLIYVQTFLYYKSLGQPDEVARDIAAMEMERYLDIEEGTL